MIDATRFSVLIVDDDMDDRFLLSTLLKEANLATVIYEKNSGADALEFLADYEHNVKKFPDDFPPILIFLDINMPRMSGLEFLPLFGELKSENQKYDVSVVFILTSFGNPHDQEKCLSYSFVKNYLSKDIRQPEEFKSLIFNSL